MITKQVSTWIFPSVCNASLTSPRKTNDTRAIIQTVAIKLERTSNSCNEVLLLSPSIIVWRVCPGIAADGVIVTFWREKTTIKTCLAYYIVFHYYIVTHLDLNIIVVSALRPFEFILSFNSDTKKVESNSGKKHKTKFHCWHCWMKC